MIGDLVYAIFDIEDENEDYITEQVPVMTTGVDDNCSLGDGYSVSYIPIGDVPDENCDCFEPIPLTAEILEKNGWSRNSIFMELDADENTQFSWANRCGEVLLKNGRHHCDCKYVHTLQHALRLCGFDELADNFKI